MPPPPDTGRPLWRFGFAALLVLAMVAATQIPVGLGILASFIRDDLGISRTQIGGLITATIVAGAVLSPGAGHVVDLLGGKRAVAVLFASAGLGFIGLAIAPGYWWMFAAIAIASISQSEGNPATNKLIAHHTAPGRRGVVTGIKQSGVQAGVFVSGLVMPLIAQHWGWRWAVALVAVVPIAGLLATWLLLPSDRPVASERIDRTTDGRLPVAIPFLAVYGGLVGFGAAYTFLVPLFTEEALGMSERAGGLAAGIIGLVALLARIGWARHADRTGRHAVLLSLLAFGSAGAVLLFLAADAGASWLLWAGVVVTGATSSSWNSVGMLAVIGHAGAERSGRASGIVMLGFLTGLGSAPTLYGWLVDRFDSYTPMWLTALGTLGLAAALSVWWVLTPRRHRLPST